MERVAPEGFRLHFDFTMGGTDDPMPGLLERLSGCRSAGCFEDPLPERDLTGYIELRKRSRLPIVLHHAPMGATYEVMMGMADAYMLPPRRAGRSPGRARSLRWSQTATGSRYSPKTARKTPHISPRVT